MEYVYDKAVFVSSGPLLSMYTFFSFFASKPSQERLVPLTVLRKHDLMQYIYPHNPILCCMPARGSYAKRR